MEPLICPTCGCSLVRLGISKDKANTYGHEGKEYFFCCQGCVDVFAANPKKRLEETKDLIVCPTCLAENPHNRLSPWSTTGRKFTFAAVRIAWTCFKRAPSTT